jgi:hypothetical protein
VTERPPEHAAEPQEGAEAAPPTQTPAGGSEGALLRDQGVSERYEDGRRYRYVTTRTYRFWIPPWPVLNRARRDVR